MKKYEYVHIVGKGAFFTVEFERYKEIINQYAEKGYRYAGFIPTRIKGYGIITEMDLIFEKDE